MLGTDPSQNALQRLIQKQGEIEEEYARYREEAQRYRFKMTRFEKIGFFIMLIGCIPLIPFEKLGLGLGTPEQRQVIAGYIIAPTLVIMMLRKIYVNIMAFYLKLKLAVIKAIRRRQEQVTPPH